MRIIDADSLKQKIKKDIPSMSNWGEIFVPNAIESEPTIDPETLLVVQQLRAEMEKVKAERDAAVNDVRLFVFRKRDACDYCKRNDPSNYTCTKNHSGYCDLWEYGVFNKWH